MLIHIEWRILLIYFISYMQQVYLFNGSKDTFSFDIS